MKYLVQQTSNGLYTFPPAVFDNYNDALVACGKYFANNYADLPNAKPYIGYREHNFTEFSIETETQVLDTYQIIEIRLNPKSLDE